MRGELYTGRVGRVSRVGRVGKIDLTYLTHSPYQTYPTYPTRLESQPESQLELALLEAGGLGKATGAERCRNRARRIAERVDLDRRIDALRLFRIEDVLELADELGSHVSADRHESRVAQVHVVAVRQVHRIAPDADRPIVVREAVAVQITPADDVERQAAVELHQDGNLIVVQN